MPCRACKSENLQKLDAELTASLPDPTDPTNLEKVSGRGLLLIRTFMDEVTHNKAGNEITMIKRLDA